MMVVLTVLQSPLEAQRQSPSASHFAIPESQRPWAGKPWLVGTVLSAGAVLIALKSAKRSHLD